MPVMHAPLPCVPYGPPLSLPIPMVPMEGSMGHMGVCVSFPATMSTGTLRGKVGHISYQIIPVYGHIISCHIDGAQGRYRARSATYRIRSYPYMVISYHIILMEHRDATWQGRPYIVSDHTHILSYHIISYHNDGAQGRYGARSATYRIRSNPYMVISYQSY